MLLKNVTMVILATLLISGCITRNTDKGPGLRLVEDFDSSRDANPDSGVTPNDSWYEKKDPETGKWYDAEQVNGKWQWSESGVYNRNRDIANAERESGGGGGGGGGY